MRVSILLFLVACSSSSTAPSPLKPTPPAWTNAPGAPVALGQGQTKDLPITLKADGEVMVQSAPPAGIDVDAAPDHLSIHADYTVSGAVDLPITLTDVHNLSTTITVHLSVAPIGWKAHPMWDVPLGPDAREHGAFIVDDNANVALMFGGTGYKPQGTPLEDAWTLHLGDSSWTKWTPKGDPIPGAGSRRVAIVPGAGLAYAFGGYTAANDLDDLFKIAYGNGDATFTKLTSTGPDTRELHVFAYDAGKQRFVLFGGYGSASGVLADTWVMTLAGDVPTWKKLTLNPHPTGRYGSFYAMDQVHHRLIVWSGGQTGKTNDPVNAASDAWSLDLSNDVPSWSPIAITGTAPKGRRNGCFVFDPSGPRMMVFGGTADQATTEPGLWFLDLRAGKESWSKVDRTGEPPLRSSSFGFLDKTGNLTCGFGNDAGLYRDLGIVGY